MSFKWLNAVHTLLVEVCRLQARPTVKREQKCHMYIVDIVKFLQLRKSRRHHALSRLEADQGLHPSTARLVNRLRFQVLLDQPQESRSRPIVRRFKIISAIPFSCSHKNRVCPPRLNKALLGVWLKSPSLALRPCPPARLGVSESSSPHYATIAGLEHKPFESLCIACSW
jgi:hypothetical protein